MPRRTNAPQKFKRSLSQNQEPILSKNCMNECLFSASLIHHESKTSGGSIVWSLNFSDVIWKSPTEKFPSLVWQYPIIQFTLYYVTSDCLREAKTKREFQTFSFKSDCCRLRQVVAYKRFQTVNIVIWLGNLVFWKTGRWGEVVTTWGSTV